MLGRVGAAGDRSCGGHLSGAWPGHMRGAGHTVESAGGVRRLALAAGRCRRGAATEAGVGAGPAAAEAGGGGGWRRRLPKFCALGSLAQYPHHTSLSYPPGARSGAARITAVISPCLASHTSSQVTQAILVPARVSDSEGPFKCPVYAQCNTVPGFWEACTLGRRGFIHVRSEPIMQDWLHQVVSHLC